MSEQAIAKKAELVKTISEQFKNATSAVVVDYLGLTVEQVTALRKELREAGVKMEVLKNTYLRRAADANGYEALDDVFRALQPLPSPMTILLPLPVSWPSTLTNLMH